MSTLKTLFNLQWMWCILIILIILIVSFYYNKQILYERFETSAPLGGYTNISVSDLNAIAAATFAVNSEYPSGTVTYDILSASSQIVAGTNYKLQIAITETANRNCIVKNYVVFQSLPNMGGTFSVSSSVKDENTTCPTSSTPSTQPLGGYSDISVSDPDVIAATEFAIHHEYPSEYPVETAMSMYHILSASMQTVAGKNYKIQVAITNNRGVCIVKTYVVFKSLPNTSGSTTFSLTSSKDEGTTCPTHTFTSPVFTFNPSISFATVAAATTAATTATAAAAPISATTAAATKAATPFATPFATTTPFVTTAATPAAAKTVSLDSVDPNGYIRLALSSLHSGQTSSALNYINLAINVQTQKGNYASVALLQAAVLYTQAMMNPLLNNFDIPASKLSNAVSYMLVGTILITLCMVNQTSSDIYKNIQQALLSLNSSIPKITSAIAYVNKARNDQLNRGNVNVIRKLEDVLKVLNNYNKPEMKRLPLTPLQLSLMDFPDILMLLDGKTSIQDYSMLWGKNSLDTKYNNDWRDNSKTHVYGSAWGGKDNKDGTDDDEGGGDSTAVPDVIQKFLYSRAMLDAAMNDMVDYLTVNQGYNELIQDIQHAKNDMNLI